MGKSTTARSGLGSKVEVRPGVWRIRVSSGYRRDGGQRSKSRTIRGDERAADMAIASLAAEMGRSPNFGDSMTVDAYWVTYFAPMRRPIVTRATWLGYDSDWRNHISPTFGRRQLDSITKSEIQRWALAMSAGAAKSSVMTLRVMLNDAVATGVLDVTPLPERSRIRYLPSKRAPKDVWHEEEVADAFTRLEGTILEPLWMASVGGGLRLEEALGLYWDDLSFFEVDTIHGPVLMCHAVIDDAVTPVDGRKATKNEMSARVVPIPEPFSMRLLELTLEGPRVPLCPLRPSSVSHSWTRLFRPETRSARSGVTYPAGPLHGLPYVQLSTMRHAHETMMQSTGTSDTLNARIHGRTNVQTGYHHYLRPATKEMDAAAAELTRRIS